MKVICTSNSALSLPAKCHSSSVPSADPQMIFPIEVGKVYIVCGIILFKDCQQYLIKTERNSEADFIPAILFRVIDGKISSQWKFWTTNSKDGYFAELILGYPELAENPMHIDDIVDGKSDALRIFHSRLEQIENELSDI